MHFLDSTKTDGITEIPYCRTTIESEAGSTNTSTLNVIAEDGFNVVQTYKPEEWSSEKTVRAMLTLFKNNKLQVHLDARFYYKPDIASTEDNPFGENTYDNCGISYNPNNSPYQSYSFRPNYVDLFNNVYSDPKFKNTIWGFHISEESAYLHYHDFTCGQALHSYTSGDPLYFKNTEVPTTNVREAMDYFKGISSSFDLNSKMVIMEANHNGRICEDFKDNDAGVYNSQDYIKLINKNDSREVFFEGSYVRFNINGDNNPMNWINEDRYDAIGSNYLGQFRSIDYAKTFTDEVYKVLSIEGTRRGSGYYKPYNYWRHLHSDSLITNANWLWFQAYTSIIHDVKGIWFWDINEAWNIGERPHSWNNFSRNHFPRTYQDYVSFLAKELRYLVNNNVISTDPNTIVATKTDTADPNSIVPAISDYIPSFLNDTEHNSEHYGLRYTIRCNGKKTYMIITNPLNVPLRNIELNFSNTANQQIQNSYGVKVLFDDKLNDVDSPQYKKNRNSNTNLQNNTVGSSYTIYYDNTQIKKIRLDFGPFDVKVLEFISYVPDFNNGWSNVWSNFGSGRIDGHQIHDDDNLLIGDFDGDGAEELFCISGGNYWNWMTILKYRDDDWVWYWSDYGISSAGAGISFFRDNMTVGDFDGDGKDEILGYNNGWIALFKYKNGDWTKFWSNNGNTNIDIAPYNHFYAGDFDGDSKDELMCYPAHNGWTTMFKWNGRGFSWVWSDYGENHPLTPYRSNMIVGDYDGDGKDEILGIDTWYTVFDYENGDWHWGWSCYGTNNFGPIDPTTPSFIIAGNVDGDRKDELFILPKHLSVYSNLISNHAKLIEFANNQNSWSAEWTPSVAFIDDWPITNSALNITRYYFIKAKVNKPAYLLALRKFGSNYLVNMYSKKSGRDLLNNSFSKKNINYSEKMLIEESDTNNLIIYPNPTTGKFSVGSEKNAITRIQIFDVVGRLVFQGDYSEGVNHVEINMTNRKPGVYIVKVTNDSNITTSHELGIK